MDRHKLPARPACLPWRSPERAPWTNKRSPEPGLYSAIPTPDPSTFAPLDHMHDGCIGLAFKPKDTVVNETTRDSRKRTDAGDGVVLATVAPGERSDTRDFYR